MTPLSRCFGGYAPKLIASTTVCVTCCLGIAVRFCVVADFTRIARSRIDRQVDPATGELLHVLEHEVRCVSHPSYPVGRDVSAKK